MKKIISIIWLFALIFAFPVRAQEPVDQSVIARIKTEGFQHSQVMETLFYLTDVYGPRLRGSANYKRNHKLRKISVGISVAAKKS